VLQHETIEQLLERGEKLDDLVQKTDKLSGTSKAFYKEVRLLVKQEGVGSQHQMSISVFREAVLCSSGSV